MSQARTLIHQHGTKEQVHGMVLANGPGAFCVRLAPEVPSGHVVVFNNQGSIHEDVIEVHPEGGFFLRSMGLPAQPGVEALMVAVVTAHRGGEPGPWMAFRTPCFAPPAGPARNAGVSEGAGCPPPCAGPVRRSGEGHILGHRPESADDNVFLISDKKGFFTGPGMVVQRLRGGKLMGMVYDVPSKGAIFSVKLAMCTPDGVPLLHIHQKRGMLGFKYKVYRGDDVMAEVISKASFFSDKYKASTPYGTWEIKGRFASYSYSIFDSNGILACAVHWDPVRIGIFAVRVNNVDRYVAEITPGFDKELCMALVIIVDKIRDANRS